MGSLRDSALGLPCPLVSHPRFFLSPSMVYPLQLLCLSESSFAAAGATELILPVSFQQAILSQTPASHLLIWPVVQTHRLWWKVMSEPSANGKHPANSADCCKWERKIGSHRFSMTAGNKNKQPLRPNVLHQGWASWWESWNWINNGRGRGGGLGILPIRMLGMTK